MKSLPKPNAKDDIEKAELAKKGLSTLKKELRSALSMQKQRLEAALSRKRYWSYDSWKSVFLENPIMKQFVNSLIWGEYTEGKLLKMFRYAEDGTFYSMIGENHEFFVWNRDWFHSSVRIIRNGKGNVERATGTFEKLSSHFYKIERPVFVVEEER